MGIPALPFCTARLTALWKPAEYPKEFRHLGDHIRAKRLDLGLQIKQLARQLGTDEGSVAAWEDGSRRPSLRKLPKVLEFLKYDPRTPSKTIGERLRQYRTARGVSHRELARAIGVDPSTVNSWERGEHKPSRKCLRMLAKVISEG